MTPPSTLFLLHADQFAQSHSRGFTVPCTSHRVASRDLVGLLFAVGFWAVHHEGSITMEVTTRKYLFFFTRTTVLCTKVRPTKYTTGVERWIGTLGDGQTVEVHQCVSRFFQRDRIDPWQVLLEHMVEQAIIAGFYDGAEERPNCAAISATADEFEQLRGLWTEFQRTQPELAALVNSQCDSAISSRRDRDKMSD